jgi:hypothetical protein
VLTAVLHELLWFRGLLREWPNRFLDLFEFEIDKDALCGLADFVKLRPDARWLDEAIACFNSDAQYDHEPELVDFYRSLVAELFGDDDEATSKLERFVRDS